MEVEDLRHALVPYLGQQLTPEVAAAIELSARVGADRSLDPSQFIGGRCNGLTFNVVRLRDVLAEWIPLDEEFHLATDALGVAHRPDVAWLLAVERAGRLLQVLARDEATGQAAGTFQLFINPSRHAEVAVGRDHYLYLRPEYRRGYAAHAFCAYAEQCARAIGVHTVWIEASEWLGPMLERMGYAPGARLFTKTLRTH